MPERYLDHDGWMEELNDEAAEHENSPDVQSVHDKRLCEGYYVDAQQQRERAEAAEAERDGLREQLETARREREQTRDLYADAIRQRDDWKERQHALRDAALKQREYGWPESQAMTAALAEKRSD